MSYRLNCRKEKKFTEQAISSTATLDIKVCSMSFSFSSLWYKAETRQQKQQSYTSIVYGSRVTNNVYCAQAYADSREHRCERT